MAKKSAAFWHVAGKKEGRARDDVRDERRAKAPKRQTNEPANACHGKELTKPNQMRCHVSPSNQGGTTSK